MIVKGLTVDRVTLGAGNGKTLSIAKDEFVREWPGVALLIERTAKTEEPGYVRNKAEENADAVRRIIGYALFAFAVSLSLLNCFQWGMDLLLALLIPIKAIGIIVSFMLVQESIGASSKFSSAICSFSSNTDCAKVVNSKASRLFGVLPLADLGLFYFVSSLLAISIMPYFEFPGTMVASMKVLNVLCLVFTFYSIYYQKVVARTWCPLCLVVMGLFWLEIIIQFVPVTFNTTVLSWNDVGRLGLGVFLVAYAVSQLVSNLKMKTTNSNMLVQLMKTKTNINLIRLALENGRPIEEPPLTVELGGKEAKNRIMAVLSLDCPSCRAAFYYLKELVVDFEDSLAVTVLILSFKRKIMAQSRAIYYLGTQLRLETKDKDRISLIVDIFDHSDTPEKLEEWINQSIVEETAALQQNEKSIAWAMRNGVDHTPTFALNGKVVSNEMNLPEIRRYLKATGQKNSGS